MSPQDYRRAFSKASSAASYDEKVYATGSSAEILWRIEKRIVRKIAEEVVSRRTNPTYLDFACGTGRVLASLEDLAELAVGVDVSMAMLDRAKEKCKRARLLCKDIAQPETEIEGQYDLITCFRFLTNAEPSLRAAALRALHKRLKDDGVLIINTHGNPWSYRLLLLPYHWAKDVLAGRPLYGYLSNKSTKYMLDAAGFRVMRIVGMGFVPQKLVPPIPLQWATAVETALAGVPIVQSFGLNQVFVCTKKK